MRRFSKEMWIFCTRHGGLGSTTTHATACICLLGGVIGLVPRFARTGKELIIVSDAQEQRKMVADVTALGVHQDVPAPVGRYEEGMSA